MVVDGFGESIDDFYPLEYIEITPFSTESHAIIFGIVEWKLTPLYFDDVVTIQPPPLCGPTNLTNSSVMACLENGNIVYNISIQQGACSLNITSSFTLNCPLLLNTPVM